MRAPLGRKPHLVDIGGLDVGRGPQMHRPGEPVDDNVVARLTHRNYIFGLPDCHQPHRARHDGHMRRRRAILEHHGPQFGAVIFEQFGRAHIARHQNGVVGHFLAGHRAVGCQNAQQPVCQIVEIVQTLANIGIGLAQHARAGVVLHTLNRSFRREARIDRLLEPAHPAPIMGKHAIGLEDVAVIGRDLHIARIEQFVDRNAHCLERSFQPRLFGVRVVGNEIGDHDARVVQHHLPQSDAFGKPHALEHTRAAQIDIGARFDQCVEIGRRDHLGQNGGRGQKCFGFVLAIDPALRILNDQHAQRLPRPQHGHAKE